MRTFKAKPWHGSTPTSSANLVHNWDTDRRRSRRPNWAGWPHLEPALPEIKRLISQAIDLGPMLETELKASSEGQKSLEKPQESTA